MGETGKKNLALDDVTTEQLVGDYRKTGRPEIDFNEVASNQDQIAEPESSTADCPGNESSSDQCDSAATVPQEASEDIPRLDSSLLAGTAAVSTDEDKPLCELGTEVEQDPNNPARKKIRNTQFESDYVVENPGFHNVGTPEELAKKLEKVGYECLPHLATQIALLLNTPTKKIRALLLEGPSGCGKSFMAKSLAKITGAELMCLSCYKNMPFDHLIESTSTLGMARAMAGVGGTDGESLMNLGILSRAFLKSQEKPVILLVDELDKPDAAIDTFFLGPIQDARIWLESRPPIDADPQNLLIMFTKNFNRKLDDALLRRCHPIMMTYLDATLARKILTPHCHPQLVANLVSVAERIQNSGGSYEFERPPAPEELLTAGHYVMKLLEWGIKDFAYVGKTVWPILCKSEHDRAVLEHMMRFHPDFMDPLVEDSRNAPLEEMHARLGRVVLYNIVEDPDAARREQAWKEQEYN
ncbi:MAG: AAA family ATPase [Candidatus Dadabacteria bacterium]|nr:MAG: AAA family ATPase [Candidatus Dadabacteria bacterium]